MTDWDYLDEALEILQEAAAGVQHDDWLRPTPCAEWSVAQVLQHAALDQMLYESSLTGSEKPQGDAFHPTGDLGEDPLAYLASAVAGTRDAFANVADDAEGVAVPLPPFTVSGRLAAGAAALDAAVHGWDIAVATGQTPSMSVQLAEELMWAAENLVEPLREWGAYAPAIPAPADAYDIDRLLYFLGRQPNWTA